MSKRKMKELKENDGVRDHATYQMRSRTIANLCISCNILQNVEVNGTLDIHFLDAQLEFKKISTHLSLYLKCPICGKAMIELDPGIAPVVQYLNTALSLKTAMSCESHYGDLYKLTDTMHGYAPWVTIIVPPEQEGYFNGIMNKIREYDHEKMFHVKLDHQYDSFSIYRLSVFKDDAKNVIDHMAHPKITRDQFAIIKPKSLEYFNTIIHMI